MKTFNPQTLRKDFPQFGDPHFHYLDSAATSLTPQIVLDKMADYYMHYRASVHRALFKEAVEATEQYETARKKVAQFINADPDEVIFTSGATESSNMLMRMIDESPYVEEHMLKKSAKNELVTTTMEHHSALLPFQQFASRRGLTIHSIPLLGVKLDYKKAEDFISYKTFVISVTLASNVTGEVNDIPSIAALAHKCGALMVVDATAAVGHIPVDVKALGADALYFSAHKMLGPTGVGVLFVKKELLEKLSPSVYGGHMVERIENGKPEWASIPSRFEAGTKDIGGGIGLGAAIDYLEKIGVKNIHAHTGDLVLSAIEKLETIPGVHIFAERDPQKNIGIVSFSCDFAHPHDVAEILSRDNIGVRPGHHCAIPLHDALGVAATLRASFHCYSTQEDVDALFASILKAKEIFL